MKANELRIGNYVHSSFVKENDYSIIIETIHDWGINQEYGAFEYSMDELTGIPLTVEWLKKFGFENSDIVPSEYYKGWFTLQCHNGIMFRCNDGCIDKKKIMFVHELQNFYYTLCGEELVLK